MMSAFFLALAASVVCCLCVPAALARRGYLDVPGERSSHTRPTPKGGGAGMVLAFVGTGVAVGAPMAFWLPGTGLAALSFYNDLHGLSPKTRLVAQTVCAVLAAGGVAWAGLAAWSAWLLPAVAFFIVATANCYNFMDGINGMAGLTGVAAFAGLAIHAGAIQPELAPMHMAVLGGLVGFLPFNLPRARMFMGDVGSIFLGFTFALSVAAMARNWAEFWMLCAFLFPFYADETATMAERLIRRESLFTPHRRHLYQVLANEMGVAHWKVSLGYSLIQVAVMALMASLSRHGAGVELGTLAALGLAWACAHWAVKRQIKDAR